MKQAHIAIFHGLGDCVNITTFVGAIKRKHPNCKITWITYEGYKGIAEHNPNINKIVTYNDKGGIAGFACDKHYKTLRSKHPKLITPASYISGLQDKTLLGDFKVKIKALGLDPNPFTPQLWITPQEIEDAKIWLNKRSIKDFVMLEAKFGSQQSFWKRQHTIKVLEQCKKKGLSVLLTHRSDPGLAEFNKITPTFCMDVNYRYFIPFYNMSKGFVGVSSSASCIVHTHQCINSIPHLEFVRGDHWSTSHYKKTNKTISFDEKQVSKLIQKKI